MEKNRQYTLDLIKVFATVCIICHHYQIYTGAMFEKINFNGGYFYFGYLVELFFTLSGFFVYKYVKKIQNGMSFKQYFMARYLRLFPMMFITAVAFCIACKAYENIYGQLFFNHEITVWGFWVSAVGIQAGWCLENPGINGITWYISVLLWLYIVLYILARISKKRSVAFCYFAVVFIFLGMAVKTYSWNVPFLNLHMARGYISFFVGILLADCYDKNKVNKKVECLATIVFIVFVVLILTKSQLLLDGFDYLLSLFFYPACIIVAKTFIFIKLFNKKVIGILGQVSFGAFMWHFVLIITLLDLNVYNNWYLQYNNRYVMLVLVLSSYIVGTITYHLVEKNSNKLIGKYLKEIK